MFRDTYQCILSTKKQHSLLLEMATCYSGMFKTSSPNITSSLQSSCGHTTSKHLQIGPAMVNEFVLVPSVNCLTPRRGQQSHLGGRGTGLGRGTGAAHRARAQTRVHLGSRLRLWGSQQAQSRGKGGLGQNLTAHILSHSGPPFLKEVQHPQGSVGGGVGAGHNTAAHSERHLGSRIPEPQQSQRGAQSTREHTPLHLVPLTGPSQQRQFVGVGGGLPPPPGQNHLPLAKEQSLRKPGFLLPEPESSSALAVTARMSTAHRMISRPIAILSLVLVLELWRSD